MIFIKLIPRLEYLKFLNNWKDRPLIKVVSGVVVNQLYLCCSKMN